MKIESLRIQEICKEKDIKQATLAEKIGTSASSLAQILNRGNPSLSTLSAIASALGVQVVDLFEKKGDFVAFVRRNGNTYTFESEGKLKEFVDSI